MKTGKLRSQAFDLNSLNEVNDSNGGKDGFSRLLNTPKVEVV
jgi:hypothetical protein